MRREIKANVKKQHNLDVSHLVGDIKANPRDFYWYINGQKKDTQGILPLKRRNGNGVAELEVEQAGEFNGQFMDVFNKMSTAKSCSQIGRLLSRPMLFRL